VLPFLRSSPFCSFLLAPVPRAVFSVAKVSVISLPLDFFNCPHRILWPLPFFSPSAWAKPVHRSVLFCPCRSSVSPVRRVSAGRDLICPGLRWEIFCLQRLVPAREFWSTRPGVCLPLFYCFLSVLLLPVRSCVLNVYGWL
jgi:hypothetical protein